MQLHRRFENLPATAKGCVLALGNFDGLHFGHRAVIDEAKKHAKILNAPLAVMSFEPHPRRLFNPNLPPLRLFTITDKLRLLRDYGVEQLFLISFNKKFSQLHANEFIQQVLINGLGIKHLVTGNDFEFGHKRSGNANTLANAPFGYSPIEPIIVDGEPCSSTRIRNALKTPDLTKVNELLGRDYHMTGRVLPGEKRGRKWGFPTANIAPPNLFSPAYGIYAVNLIKSNGDKYNGVANYGIRPMYPLKHPLLEVHLFDVSPNLYGERVSVTFNKYLREEMIFPDEETLIKQIGQDEQDARNFFASAEGNH